MRTQAACPPGRAGFSVIELLVVMTILAILVALITGATIRLLGRGPEMAARNEVGQLEAALRGLMAERQLEYVPSKLLLREDNYDTSNAQHRESIAFLTKMFGSRIIKGTTNPRTVNIDWNGNGSIDGNKDMWLEGHQVLVFILGGIPKSSGGTHSCTGFADSSTDPASGAGTRIAPTYSFKSERLRADGNGFLYYYDPFGTNQAYAFFAAGRTGYNPTDCQSMNVQPYKLPSGEWVNARSFQIICAGPDGNFGNSWTWSPGGGLGGAGADNLANFARGRLGTAN